MNKIMSDPMEPDSNIIINESQIHIIIKDIATKISELKSKYPHFNEFDIDSAIHSSRIIWYKNNINYEPNPAYLKELNERKTIPPIKKPLPPQEVAVYSEHNGLELFIEFTDSDIFQTGQRVWLPNVWIGNFAVELKVKGAETKDIEEIFKNVIEILKSIKKEYEK